MRIIIPSYPEPYTHPVPLAIVGLVRIHPHYPQHYYYYYEVYI
jgi:hypothetical protein